jgi:hypothetical protein
MGAPGEPAAGTTAEECVRPPCKAPAHTGAGAETSAGGPEGKEGAASAQVCEAGVGSADAHMDAENSSADGAHGQPQAPVTRNEWVLDLVPQAHEEGLEYGDDAADMAEDNMAATLAATHRDGAQQGAQGQSSLQRGDAATGGLAHIPAAAATAAAAGAARKPAAHPDSAGCVLTGAQVAHEPEHVRAYLNTYAPAVSAATDTPPAPAVASGAHVVLGPEALRGVTEGRGSRGDCVSRSPSPDIEGQPPRPLHRISVAPAHT